MSHFSRIKTKITDKNLLIACLNEMGYQILENTELKGFNETKKVDLLIKMSRGYDVGFSKNAQGSYDIMADWNGVKKLDSKTFSHELVEQFETVKNKIKQEYAIKTIEEMTEKSGFELVKKENNLDNSVRILVRRWTD